VFCTLLRQPPGPLGRRRSGSRHGGNRPGSRLWPGRRDPFCG